MRPCDPWLAQGDVFSNIPVLFAELEPTGRVRFREDRGPAMLLTEGCQLDKRTPSGERMVQRFQFAPIRAAQDFDPGARDLVSQLQISPPEAIYVDDVQGQEGVVLLGEAYPLPAEYFKPELQDFSHHEMVSDGTDPVRLVATADHDRVCTMLEAERLLLHDKLPVYWTYRQAEGPTLFDPRR